MATAKDLAALLDRQGARLERLDDRQARSVLRVLEDSRREVRELLLASGGASDTWTATRWSSSRVQIDDAIRRLKFRFNETLEVGFDVSHKRAVSDLLAVVRKGDGAAAWAASAGGIEFEALAKLSDPNRTLLHRYSVNFYGSELADKIQRELARSVALRRTVGETSDAVASTSFSTFSSMEHRADLIVRMEMNRAYNDAHDAAAAEASKRDRFAGKRGPLIRKIDEFRDHRNHPISVAINGLGAEIGKPFRIPVVEVRAAAHKIGKPVSGILWTKVGTNYEGMSLPAHFGERGRIVPWRQSWGPVRMSA